MIVQKTSVFPAAKETVFRKLQQLETLQYIAKPYAAFEPIGEAVSIWAVGSTSAYRFRIFGVIPYGTHTIHAFMFGGLLATMPDQELFDVFEKSLAGKESV